MQIAPNFHRVFNHPSHRVRNLNLSIIWVIFGWPRGGLGLRRLIETDPWASKMRESLLAAQDTQICGEEWLTHGSRPRVILTRSMSPFSVFLSRNKGIDRLTMVARPHLVPCPVEVKPDDDESMQNPCIFPCEFVLPTSSKGSAITRRRPAALALLFGPD